MAKTTMLNCLTAAIPSRERVVTCGEVFELKMPLPDVVAMQCQQPSLEGHRRDQAAPPGQGGAADAHVAHRVGEVRQEESLHLSRDLHSGVEREGKSLARTRAANQDCLVPPAGFEPATHGLGNRRPRIFYLVS